MRKGANFLEAILISWCFFVCFLWSFRFVEVELGSWIWPQSPESRPQIARRLSKYELSRRVVPKCQNSNHAPNSLQIAFKNSFQVGTACRASFYDDSELIVDEEAHEKEDSVWGTVVCKVLLESQQCTLHLRQSVPPAPRKEIVLFPTFRTRYPINHRTAWSVVTGTHHICTNWIIWEPESCFHIHEAWVWFPCALHGQLREIGRHKVANADLANRVDLSRCEPKRSFRENV